MHKAIERSRGERIEMIIAIPDSIEMEDVIRRLMCPDGYPALANVIMKDKVRALKINMSVHTSMMCKGCGRHRMYGRRIFELCFYCSINKITGEYNDNKAD